MQCPACSVPCAETDRFCSQCGTAFTIRCEACGAQLVPQARFCHHCGASAQVPAPAVPAAVSAPTSRGDDWVGALEGEKRLGTILFADMSDSVAITSELHPEDALTLINELLRVIAEAIFANGGRVDRFLGDGALGVFGVTHTHESDPERAILAALQIRDAARELGLEVTVGINTGDVYAGGVGSEQYQEHTVMGPVVNLASRLQSMAAPGEILVGETTYRIACRAFSFTPRKIEVRGLPQSSMAYSVDGALARPSSRPLGSRRAELVGRDRQLTALLQAATAARSGHGQAVALIGEPGVGKSRLMAELRRSLESASPDGTPEFTWLDGRCLEFSEAVGYWPFVDLLHHWLDWHAEDEDELRHARIVRHLADLRKNGLLNEEEEQSLLLVLESLLSVRFTNGIEALPERTVRPPRHQMFHALRHLLLALAQQRPLVLALEDLHWADSLSLEFLSFVLEQLPTAPLLLLWTHRPEESHPCQQVRQAAARKCPDHYLELRLTELSGEESTQLASSLLGNETLSEPVQELIQVKCHGNPLFIEEVVRAMVDSGSLYATPEGWEVTADSEEIKTPETIQSVILSRVDRLPPNLKQLLQYASVLGPVFQPRLLEHLGMEPPRLRQELFQLSEAGLVIRQRVVPDEEFTFKHALTRETIYDTILRRTRKRLHAAAAEALERVYSGRLEELYAELGRHYSLAERGVQAASYYIRAGERAKRLFANREAGSHFERALQALAREKATEETRRMTTEALEGLGDVCFRLGSHHTAEVHFLHARQHLNTQLDSGKYATLSWKLADAIHWQGKMQRAIEVAEQGLAVAGGSRATPAVVRLREVIMRSYWAEADLVNARHHGEALEAALPEVPYFESLYMIHYALAWLEIKWRQFDRARYWLETMRVTCETHHDEIGLARCLHGLGDLSRATQDFAEAADWFSQSVVLCERIGDAHLLMEGYLEWAQVLIQLGRPESEAEPYLKRGLAIAEEMAATGGVSSIQAQCNALGRAFVAQGNIRRAIYFFERSFDFGPHPLAAKSLEALQPLYEQAGRAEEFQSFCERVGEQIPTTLQQS